MSWDSHTLSEKSNYKYRNIYNTEIRFKIYISKYWDSHTQFRGLRGRWRPLSLSKLIYGQTCRLFGWQMSGDPTIIFVSALKVLNVLQEVWILMLHKIIAS